MGALRICDAKAVSICVHIELYFFYLRILHICKINMHKISDGACHLIHQSARLSEIHILCILSDDCDCDCINAAIVIQIRKNRSDYRLKGCR